MSEMKKVRLAIFGIGHNHAAAAIKTVKARGDVEILGYCEPDANMRERRERENPTVYGDLAARSKEELLALSPDAAMVEAAVPQLTFAAAFCVENRLHVYMDKPGGTDLAEYEKLLRAADERGLVFRTGYMYRYNAGVRYVLDKAQSGALGRIYNISAVMSTKHPEWFKRQLLSYGVPAPEMYIFGCHLIDLALTLKGEPASMSVFHTASGDGGVEMPDTSLAVLQYPDGIAQLRVSSVEINGWGMREFTVYGEKGMISVSPIENKMQVRQTMLEEESPWQDRSKKIELAETGRYAPMFDEFFAAVRGETKNDNHIEHELLLQKLTLRASGVIPEDLR